MAQSFVITHPHPRRWIVDITETAVSDGETLTIQPDPTLKFPKTGRIMRITSVLESGDATTVAPTVSTVTTFNGPEVAIETEPGSPVDEAIDDGIPYGLTSDKFYWRSNPNIGSNNSIRSRLLVEDAWGE